jgi:hypothetical protein
MFKVSVKQESVGTSLYVEGRLAGPWVLEMEKCWQAEQARVGSKIIIVRLGAVTFIDDEGKALLARMFQGGAKLEGHGCLVRAILDGITGHGEAEHEVAEAHPKPGVMPERPLKKQK